MLRLWTGSSSFTGLSSFLLLCSWAAFASAAVASDGTSPLQQEAPPLPVQVGTLLQVWAIPWLGGDALVQEEDWADERGFRLRRARINLRGDVTEDTSMSFSVDVERGGQERLISSAYLDSSLLPELRLRAGFLKVPFTRSDLVSRAFLLLPERSPSVRTLANKRRAGLLISGTLRDSFTYYGGIYNSSAQFTYDDDSSGQTFSGRLELHPWGAPGSSDSYLGDGPLRVTAGIALLLQQAKSAEDVAIAADLMFKRNRYSLRGHVISDSRETANHPSGPNAPSSPLEDRVHLGWGLQGGYTVVPARLQLTAQIDRLEEDHTADDSGDNMFYTVGLNFFADGHQLMGSLNYRYRQESGSPNRANNALLLVVQAVL